MKKKVIIAVNNVLKERFNICVNNFDLDYDTSFWGNDFSMNPREVIILISDVFSYFNIKCVDRRDYGIKLSDYNNLIAYIEREIN